MKQLLLVLVGALVGLLAYGYLATKIIEQNDRDFMESFE